MTNEVILLGRVGSHAYGLNHAESDEDFLGVFVAPTVDIAGLHWNSARETSSQSSQGNAENDQTIHEVGKFLRLCLKSNPTVTELLWLDDYITTDDYEVAPGSFYTGYGRELVSIRSTLVSEQYVRAAYRGYASQQLQKFAGGDWKPKHARHCLRLIRQGVGLIKTGQLEVRVPDPQLYWDLAEMAPDKVIEILKKEIDHFDDVVVTPLPVEPDDAAASALLRDIRMNYLTGSYL